MELPFYNFKLLSGSNVTGDIARIDGIPRGQTNFKVWAFYHCDRYAASFGSYLDFYGQNGAVALSLPAVVQPASGSRYGLVQSITTTVNAALTNNAPGRVDSPPRMIQPWAFHFNTSANDNQNWITPFDLKIDCAQVVFRTDNPLQVAGVNVLTWLFLAVLASPESIRL